MQEMASKTCTRCGVTLPRSAFYLRNEKGRSSDAVTSRCKKCCDASRVYRRTDDTAHHARAWEKKKNNPVQARARQARLVEWKRANPEKVAAHRAANRAQGKGLIQRPDACETCSRTGLRLHKHHSDYSKPLDVAWLCTRCHMRLHADEGK